VLARFRDANKNCDFRCWHDKDAPKYLGNVRSWQQESQKRNLRQTDFLFGLA
jgi:hypothetical protein